MVSSRFANVCLIFAQGQLALDGRISEALNEGRFQDNAVVPFFVVGFLRGFGMVLKIALVLIIDVGLFLHCSGAGGPLERFCHFGGNQRYGGVRGTIFNGFLTQVGKCRARRAK